MVSRGKAKYSGWSSEGGDRVISQPLDRLPAQIVRRKSTGQEQGGKSFAGEEDLYFCFISLPLASTRWPRLTLSSICPLASKQGLQ